MLICGSLQLGQRLSVVLDAIEANASTTPSQPITVWPVAKPKPASGPLIRKAAKLTWCLICRLEWCVILKISVATGPPTDNRVDQSKKRGGHKYPSHDRRTRSREQPGSNSSEENKERSTGDAEQSPALLRNPLSAHAWSSGLTKKLSHRHLGENADNFRSGTTARWVRKQPAWRSDRTTRDHVTKPAAGGGWLQRRVSLHAHSLKCRCCDALKSIFQRQRRVEKVTVTMNKKESTAKKIPEARATLSENGAFWKREESIAKAPQTRGITTSHQTEIPRMESVGWPVDLALTTSDMMPRTRKANWVRAMTWNMVVRSNAERVWNACCRLTNKVSYSHLVENADNSRDGTTAWWVRTQPAWRSDRIVRDHVTKPVAGGC